MSERFFTRSIAIVLLAWIVLSSAMIAAENESPGASAASDEISYPQETLPDSAGGHRSLPASRGRVATVLVCMSVDCPISNEYIATLNGLADRVRARGVNFIGINPNSGQTLRDMADYLLQLKLAFPFVKDEGAKVCRRLSFHVTPEACVFDAAGKLAYRGRIDDRYRARSGAAGETITPDLERALDELITGKPVSVTRTKAIGCPLQFGSEHGLRPAGNAARIARKTGTAGRVN